MIDNESDNRLKRPAAACLALALVGAVSLAAGFLLAPQRTWEVAFVACNFLLGLGLGALVFLAFHYVTGAKWSLPLLRAPEAMTAVTPVAAAGLAVVLPVLFFRYSLWGASTVPLRRLWLDPAFFLAHSVIYVAVWTAFGAAIVRNSRRQDGERNGAPTERNLRLSAFFLAAYGVTCWLSSSDWLMSLEPNWSSTIYGVYNFSGMFLGALAAAALLVIWLRRREPMRGAVNADQLHDLGALLFGFSCFWTYIWFCQYLLIWFVNNPEETVYFREALQGPWTAWLLVDLALNGAIPFVVLLFRSAKPQPVVPGGRRPSRARREVGRFVVDDPALSGGRVATAGAGGRGTGSWHDRGLCPGGAVGPAPRRSCRFRTGAFVTKGGRRRTGRAPPPNQQHRPLRVAARASVPPRRPAPSGRGRRPSAHRASTRAPAARRSSRSARGRRRRRRRHVVPAPQELHQLRVFLAGQIGADAHVGGDVLEVARTAAPPGSGRCGSSCSTS